MTILKRLAGEVSDKVTREVAAKTTARATTKAAVKDVAAETTRKAAKALGRDVLTKSADEVAKKGAKKAADAAVNPMFDAAMAAVREQLSKQGKYANVSTRLLEAVSHAKTTEEALQVASLARKLSVQFNDANRGALLHALEEAASKAKVHEEAFKTLTQVVKTREQAYAMFSLAEKNKLVEHAVDRYMTVGGAEVQELATKAIKLVPARFDQRSAKHTIKAVSLMDQLADQVRTIANFLNKALS